MSFDVFVSEHALWVHGVQDIDEVIKAGIQPTKVVGAKRVRFCPMRSSAVACDQLFESREEFPVRHVEPVRPARWCVTRVDKEMIRASVSCNGT